MSTSKRIRLHEAAREFGVSLASVAEALEQEGFELDDAFDANPNSWLTAEMYGALGEYLADEAYDRTTESGALGKTVAPPARAGGVAGPGGARPSHTLSVRTYVDAGRPAAGWSSDAPCSLFVRLTTTGARQVLAAFGEAGTRDDLWDDTDRADRLRAAECLRKAVGQSPTVYLSRRDAVDLETGWNQLALRFPDAGVDLLLARKHDCLLVIGARRSASARFVHEVELTPRLQVDVSCAPPLPEALLAHLDALPTQQDRSDEVDARLKRWTAYLDVEQRQAEAQRFSVPYVGLRHLENPGRIRLTLAPDLAPDETVRLASHRDRVDLSVGSREEASGERWPKRVARGDVKSFDRKAGTLTVELDDDDADSLRAGRLTLPEKGLVVNQAAGSLAMIRRQQQAIERLKLHGAALPDLDRILFGGNDDLPLTLFPPVGPVPLEECLAPDRINERQRLAVALALHTPDCLFLQGPPGTGKTTVIAELCYQIARRGQRVLVASQANLAVDNALSRLQDSREILAVRVGPSDKVEEDAQEFVGERAVQRWLRSVETHTREQVAQLQRQLEAREWFDAHREALAAWAQKVNAEQARWVRLGAEATALDEQAKVQDENSRAAAQEASDLRRLAEALGEETDPSDEILSLWNSTAALQSRETWAQATESVRRGTGSAAFTPWALATALTAWAARRLSGGTFDVALALADTLLAESADLPAAVSQAQTAYRDTSNALDGAERRLAALQTEAHESPARLAAARQQYERLSGMVRAPVLEPTWADVDRASSLTARLRERMRRAKMLTTIPGRPGAPRQAHYDLGALAEAWAEFEREGREVDAEAALTALEAGVAVLSDRAGWPLIGALYFRPLLNDRLGQLRDALSQLGVALSGGRCGADAAVHAERAAYLGQFLVVLGREEAKAANLEAKLASARDEVTRDRQRRDEARAKEWTLGVTTEGLLRQLRDQAGQVTGTADALSVLIGKARNEPVQAYTRAVELFADIREKKRTYVARAESYWQTMGAARTKAVRNIRSAEKRAEDAAAKLAADAETLRNKASANRRKADGIQASLASNAGLWAEARRLAEPLDLPDLPTVEHVGAAEHAAVGVTTSLAQTRRTLSLLTDWAERLNAGGEVGHELTREFHRRVNVVGVTCAHAAKKEFHSEFGEFDVVIVDEVSKATPTELLLPALLGRRVVLVGDHRQLPPIFGEEDSFAEAAEMLGLDAEQFATDLQASLFKERYEYLAALPGGDGAAVPQAPRAVMLTTQYRMHSHIMEGINQFYDDRLELGRLQRGGTTIVLDDDRHHGLDCPPWLRPDDHLVWIDTPLGRDWSHTQDGTTRHNEREVEVVRRVLTDLLGSVPGEPGAAPLDVGVTSVYAAQVRKLRSTIDRAQFSGEAHDRLRVSTVDRFQGMERDIMVVSLVLNGPGHKPGGFLRTPERVNVAMSRARRLLVIVGSSHNYCELPGGDNPYARFYSVAHQLGRVVDANHLLHA